MRTWSTQQQDIFKWFEGIRQMDTNLVVRARAGTGKTTVILEGAKRAPRVPTLVCAFSKIIQLEFGGKLKLDPNDKPETRPIGHIDALTLHSVGFTCVRQYRTGIKVEFNSTRADALALEVCGPRVPDTIVRLVSKLHTKGREIAPHAKSPGDLMELAIKFECEPDEVWARSGYTLENIEDYALQAMDLASNIKNGETIDGSDMIFLPVRNGWLIPKYQLVVVDEAQDMTTAQLEIAMGVLKPGGRICVVGDDKQAIFGFRGADSDSLDRLKRELGAAELGLTTTYRCGRQIVELAKEYVPDYEAGADNPEGEILDIPESELVNMAGPSDYILSRVNAPLVGIAIRLLRAGKRTRIAGKDIGRGLVALVRKVRGKSVPDFLTKVAAWEEKQLMRLQRMHSVAVNGRKATIEMKMEDIRDQAAMLLELADGASSVSDIEDRIVALFQEDEQGVKGMITCSSVHKAKGLEANRVFILEKTLRDHSQEEKNIKYVAITRAKQTLVWIMEERDA